MTTKMDETTETTGETKIEIDMTLTVEERMVRCSLAIAQLVDDLARDANLSKCGLRGTVAARMLVKMLEDGHQGCVARFIAEAVGNLMESSGTPGPDDDGPNGSEAVH